MSLQWEQTHPTAEEVCWACVRVELDTLREEQRMTDLQTMERANQEMGREEEFGAFRGLVNVGKFYFWCFVIFGGASLVARALR